MWLVSDEFSKDARLFHTLEIIGMLASYRVLLSKLHIMKASHARREAGGTIFLFPGVADEQRQMQQACTDKVSWQF